MAQKKKSVKKKSAARKGRPAKSSAAQVERSSFWPLAGAIGLVLLAFLLLLGGFGVGGPLPVNLFKGAYWLLGWVAYATPVALVYWGVHKFKSEDRQIPLDKLVGMLALLLFASCWAYVTFATKNPMGNWAGGHGGEVGLIIGNVVLAALDKVPASLVFLVLTVISVFFAFGIDLKNLLKVGNLFKKQEGEGSELADLKAKADPDFKLNEGVPVEHHRGGPQPAKLTTLKNTADKLAGNEDHEALTAAADPDWQFPSIDLLNKKQDKADAGDVNANARPFAILFPTSILMLRWKGPTLVRASRSTR